MEDDPETPEPDGEPDQTDADPPRVGLLHIALEAAVPALFMGGLWVTGNWQDQYPVSTVFVLAVAAWALTWWAGHRFKPPYPLLELASAVVPMLILLAMIGRAVFASRFPELALNPLHTAIALVAAAVVANEVTSVVGFADTLIMLVLGFVVPQIAFTLGYPSGLVAKLFLALLVLVPLGVFVFNQGIDEDVGARVLAPLIGLCLSYTFKTPEPQFDIGASLLVAGVLIVVRVLVKGMWWASGHMKTSSFLLWTSAALILVDFDAVETVLPGGLIDW
ncbi:hypothetical protein [Glycomyces sp. NPDC047010]|uniref:hypothetical protein n=1 Tax=Glycomyces sp. NPDC047010 TaxID=3155023 RepID=UPI0034091B7C